MSVSTRQAAKTANTEAGTVANNMAPNESPQPSQATSEIQSSQPVSEVDFHALFNSLFERVEQIAKEVSSFKKQNHEHVILDTIPAEPHDDTPAEPINSPILGDSAKNPPETCLRSLYGKFSPPKVSPRFAEQSIDQLESWLDINQIFKDRERFLLLKMSIEPETYRQVSTALTNKHPGKEYETLKHAIIQANTDSEAKQIQNLLSGLKLGDRRPSQLLAEMCGLYKGPKDKIFEELFLSRLPGNVRGILVSMRNDDSSPNIETIAKWADSIIEQLNVPPMISAISDNSAIAALQAKMDNMMNTFTNNNAHFKKPFNNKNNNRQGNDSNKENKNSVICYFHKKFGNNNHENTRCLPWCSLNKNWKSARANKQKN